MSRRPLDTSMVGALFGAALGFLIGVLIGSGLVWEYKNSQIKKIESAAGVATLTLRDGTEYRVVNRSSTRLITWIRYGRDASSCDAFVLHTDGTSESLGGCSQKQ
jgi:hypothetical protein